MADISVEVQARLNDIATTTGKTYDEVLAKYNEISAGALAQSIADPDGRTKTIFRILTNKLAAPLIAGAKGEKYTVLFIDGGSPHKAEVPNKGKDGVEVVDICNAIVLVRTEALGVVKNSLAEVAFWRESSSKVKDLQPGAVYEAMLAPGKSSSENALRYINAGNASWVPTGKTVDLAQITKMVIKPQTTEYTKLVAVDDKGRPAGPLYGVEASLVRTFVGSDKESGRQFCALTTRPEDMSMEEFIDKKGLTVYVDPRMARYGDDSLVLLIGRFAIGKKGIHMQGSGVVPINAIPRAEQTVSEEVSSKLAGESVLGAVKSAAAPNPPREGATPAPPSPSPPPIATPPTAVAPPAGDSPPQVQPPDVF